MFNGNQRALPAALGLLLIGLLGVAGCDTTPRIKAYHDYNPQVNFTGYQSFSFMSANPMIVSQAAGAVSPLLEVRIMNAIRNDLTRKGLTYVEDPEQANAVISFTVGSRDQIKVDQYPTTYRAGYSSYYRGGYGMGYGTATETRVRQYTEGQLAVDVFDVKTRAPAFHGTATTRITSSQRENPEQFINAVVVEALMGFPPGATSSGAQPALIPMQNP